MVVQDEKLVDFGSGTLICVVEASDKIPLSVAPAVVIRSHLLWCANQICVGSLYRGCLRVR